MLIVQQIAAVLTIIYVSTGTGDAQRYCGFRCDNGQCISSYNLCDGRIHCLDSSDESAFKCKDFVCFPTAFRCAYGACIDGNLQCNGIRDCADGSDERFSLCSEWLRAIRPIRPSGPTRSTRPIEFTNCRAPPQPENGHWQLSQGGENYNVSEGTELELGSHLVYSCNPGYELTGFSDVICTLTGWLDKPSCSANNDSDDARRNSACGLKRFQCRNGECIPSNLLCDGVAHCRDLSDETMIECNDNSCIATAFRCAYGACIDGNLLCNGENNCADGSDEYSLLCSNYNGSSVPLVSRRRTMSNYQVFENDTYRSEKKNYENHFESGGVERLQTNNAIPTYTDLEHTNPRNNICGFFSFQCRNGDCIVSDLLCDGVAHCEDSSDETVTECNAYDCIATAFRCTYGACINGSLLCDGKNDCADGSDENLSLCSERHTHTQTSQPTPRSTTQTTPRSTPRPTTQSTLRSTPRPTPHLLTSLPFVSPVSRICRAPPQPENGHRQLHQSQCSNGENCDVLEGTELVAGSYLIYSCNSGYKLNGSRDVSCSIEGKWLNIPVCSEIRCKPLSTVSTEARCVYNDESVSCESPVLPSTKAFLSCRNSYRRETTINYLLSRNEVICNANGQWEPQPIRCVPVCGKLPAKYIPHITGGVAPNITEFPWHASMYQEQPDKSKKYFCAATIIRESLLITAAHCVYDETNKRVVDASKIYVATGNIFRDYDSPLHDSLIVNKNRVKNIHIICSYLGLSGNYVSDIAILELVEPFVLSTLLVPACIDSFSDHTVLEVGVHGKVAGFGRTAISDTSAILQALRVPYIPYNQCQPASQSADAEQFIANDKFCAGYLNGSSVCDGDSGGGFVVKTGDLWYLRGIVSVSLGTINNNGNLHCNYNLYSLYTRIFSHIQWIQDVLSRIEQNRPYPSCPNKSRL